MRTKNWLLIGTILPGLIMAQGGFAAPTDATIHRLAQASVPPLGQPEQAKPPVPLTPPHGVPIPPPPARAQPEPPRAPLAPPQRQPAAAPPHPPAAPAERAVPRDVPTPPKLETRPVPKAPAAAPPVVAPLKPQPAQERPAAPAPQPVPKAPVMPVPPAPAPVVVPPPVVPPPVVPPPQNTPVVPAPQAGSAPKAPPPAVAPTAPMPGGTGLPPPAPGVQGGRKDPGARGAAAVGIGAAVLGAGVLGGILSTQAGGRLEDIRRQREETRQGDVTIVREPGLTILRDNERAIIRHDETQRFRDLGLNPQSDRLKDENRTVFTRPDGTRIVTLTDQEGRLIRRTRQPRGGVEIVLIDNTRRDRPGLRFSDDIVVFDGPPLILPREHYIVEADMADEGLIYETLMAPPIAPFPRRYTLDEVRYSPDLRARMRSVDINSVTFESGSWDVASDQVPRLAVIAQSITQALKKSPNEVFMVEGYTDAIGTEIDNLSLSYRRAQSIAAILSRDFAVPPENLTAQGYGEQYLKVPVQGASRENRRVTLRRITPLLAGQSPK
ncbi:MAG: flagellar motor protein MotB [Rhizobiales bacterium PAR1]|nr:MAG: flagellar motor protein MotB [Rhizobiales bacterium PAR1]